MKNIQLLENGKRFSHQKASESYVSVKFQYASGVIFDVWVPVEYRRTGIDIKENDQKKLNQHLKTVFEQMDPSKRNKWIKEQQRFWETKPRATVTKEFFDCLSKKIKWCCAVCDLPKNPNPARRIQDLKEFGYTISTNTNKYCKNCKGNTTQFMLLQMDRVNMKGNGYETISSSLRKKIITTLKNYDAYEAKHHNHLLPDHKFSEIRWGNDTKTKNPENMSADEINNKFQLLTNQRNQEKREVCRKCFQTNKRGTIFGISYYFQGTENWDPSIPKKGKDAEKGCYGCPWYDIEKWRKHLLELIQNSGS